MAAEPRNIIAGGGWYDGFRIVETNSADPESHMINHILLIEL